ncbi:MAG: 4-hydroxy-tetrahydrodipicolinate synthase [Cytophagales bacterium]|nr:4-hydroxy-tetrahydrodipicolinate synthase [Cytophagales bacterium]MDW8384555.1 4-hydroxy-tetrahydrodipicolinate synthase [Flammeovirgaceae bacterium]
MASDIQRLFYGTGVALVTPFKDDKRKSIDFEQFKKLLDYTGKYVDYWVVNGTTAESPTLTQEERNELLRTAVTHNSTKRPIMFGVGRNSTEETIEALQTIDLTGVDAILTVSPYYNKPSQRGLIAHYTAIADASPKPIVMYNVPGRTGTNMEAETTLRLAEHPNIIGIKEASGNLMQAMKIAKDKPKDFLLISGDDLFTIPMMSFGAVGVISVAANAFPLEISRSVRAAFRHQFQEAMKDMFALYEIINLLFAEGNPVGIKLLLEILGLCSKEVRLPLVAGSDKLLEKMLANLEELKLVCYSERLRVSKTGQWSE